MRNIYLRILDLIEKFHKNLIKFIAPLHDFRFIYIYIYIYIYILEFLYNFYTIY